MKSFAIGAFLEYIVVKRVNDDLCYNSAAVISRLTLAHQFPRKKAKLPSQILSSEQGDIVAVVYIF